MKLLLSIAAGGVALGLLVAVAWSLALKRAFGSAANKLGAPTPETARVEIEGQDVLERVDAQARKDKEEIASAKGPSLVALVRRRLFPGK